MTFTSRLKLYLKIGSTKTNITFWGLSNKLKSLSLKFASFSFPAGSRLIIELRKSNGTLINLLRPPHPPLSPESGGEDKGEGV